MTDILIIEDDSELRELLCDFMAAEGFSVHGSATAEDGIAFLETGLARIILLDLMLPGIDGYEVCQQIRKTKDTPIIILSAKGEVFDKVLGLKIGADDYIIKPFDSNELVARVHAVLRRSGTSKSEEPVREEPANPQDFEHTGNYIEYPHLIVNISNYTVTLDGRNIEMPPKELELLYFLASKPNQVFTRDQLLNQLWGYDFMGDTRTVDVHVKRLREKLNGNYNWCISTVWRIGYKFEVK